MKFRPLHDRVVIRRVDAEAKSAGGIIIPDTVKEKPSQGEVIAVGPGGPIYLADTENHVIRTIRHGTITTIVGDGRSGDGPDGDPLRCRLNRPHGVFVDNRGTLYISDSSNHRVRMLRAN